MYFLTFYYFFIYQNPKSLCFSHSLQNSFIHAYLLTIRAEILEDQTIGDGKNKDREKI